MRLIVECCDKDRLDRLGWYAVRALRQNRSSGGSETLPEGPATLAPLHAD